MDSGPGVGPDAGLGTVRIDLDTAQRLLARLGDLRSRAHELVAEGARLDHPLRFGDSWVAQLMAGQLRGVGVEHDGGLTPALRTFHRVLDELEALVRSSVDQYQQNEDDAVARLHRAAGNRGALGQERPR